MRVTMNEDRAMVRGRGGDHSVDSRYARGRCLAQSHSPQGDGFTDGQNSREQSSINLQYLIKLGRAASSAKTPINFNEAKNRDT